MRTAAVVVTTLSFAASAVVGAAEQDLHKAPETMRGSVGEGVPEGFAVREGYRVTLAAEDLPEARFLQFGDDGTLYLSQPRSGQIMSLKDADGDGTYETRETFLKDEGNPHSMDFDGGYLFYSASEPGYLKKARDTDGDGVADETVTIIAAGQSEGIPGGGGHPFRGVLVEPDRILITVSDPGNMTAELDSDRKTLYSFAPDGSGREVFAHGIRNTEKIRHRVGSDGEETAEVWGADHGSDWFGRAYGDRRGSQPITDHNPPDELNHLEEGKFYGHPYLMADLTPRPEFVDRDDLHELAEKTVPAAWSFVAHSATNGFAFAEKSTGELFDEPTMTGDLFQAQHGSWNRSEPVGYAVVRVLFDEATGRPYGEQKVVDCHTGEGQPAARPVDCAVAPDGSILFSCDATRRIYRISPEN